MNMRVLPAASALILAFAASHTAAASTLYLDYQGVTDGASFLNGTTIAPGVNFSISAAFSTSSQVAITTGAAEYLPSSISIVVGGVSYFDPSDSLGIVLVDATNPDFPGFNIPALEDLTTGSLFTPAYTGTTTTGWSATSPTATGFTGYAGSVAGNQLVFDTTAGTLAVDYGATTGVDSSISAVPEGGSFTYLAIGLAVLGLGTVFGRKAMTTGFPTGLL